MSTLVMVLAATLVAGSAPEKVSGEVEQRLDMRGEWKGICRGWPRAEGQTLNALIMAEGGFVLYQGNSGIGLTIRWVDEGQGKLLVRGIEGKVAGLGIYRQESDWLVICLRQAEDGRATSFQPAEGQYLLTLRRVKPRK